MIYDKEGELESNLRASLASFVGRPVGVGDAPFGDKGEPKEPDFPYAIIYPLPGGTFSGSLAQPEEDAMWVGQVNSVGTTPESARWLSGRVRRFFMQRADNGFTNAIDPGDGWTINDRRVRSGGGVEPGKKALFSVAESYALSITAS